MKPIDFTPLAAMCSAMAVAIRPKFCGVENIQADFSPAGGTGAMAICGVFVSKATSRMAIETGVAVVIKQAGRRVAGWRGIGDYPGTTGYTPGEMVRSVFAGSQPHIDRPVFRRADGSAFHDHKGFNWRVLRAALAVRFDILRTLTSPVSWLGPQLATQVWFVARRRALPGTGAGRS